MAKTKGLWRRGWDLWIWLPALALTLITGSILWKVTVDSLADMEVDVATNTPDCVEWADTMRAAGYRVRIRVVGAKHIAEDRRTLSLPFTTTACYHAHFPGGPRYMVIGNVPPDHVRDLLARHPAIQGLIQKEPDNADPEGSTTWSFGGRDGPKRWSLALPESAR